MPMNPTLGVNPFAFTGDADAPRELVTSSGATSPFAEDIAPSFVTSAPRVPAFNPPPPAPSARTPSFLGQAMPLLALALARGNPQVMAAGMTGWMQGKRSKEEAALALEDRTRKRQLEAAEFYTRAMQQLGTIDDPVIHAQAVAALEPMWRYHGINPASVPFNDKKLDERTRREAAELLDKLDAKHPDGNYTLDWKDPRTGKVRRIARAELAGYAGRAAFDASGTVLTPTKATNLQPKNIVVNGKRITGNYNPVDGKFYDQQGAEIPNAVLYDDEPALSLQPRDVVVNGKRVSANYNPRTGKYYDQSGAEIPNALEYERPRVSEGGGGANETRTNARVDRIVASFNAHPLVKEYNEVQAQHGIIQRVVTGGWSGPGDMAAVFAFMKALDPTSVVRETEYDNAAKSGNIFAGWAARFNGALNPNGGFLSDQVRRDFLKTIASRLDIKTKQYGNLRQQLVSRVDRIKAGAPETGDEALIDYSSALDEKPAPATPGASPTKVGRFEIIGVK